MSGHLTEFVRAEQERLWGDLDNAIRYAYNGTWSLQATSVAGRIIAAARLVGPTPYGSVQWPLVAGGVYEAVLAVGEVAPDLPSDEAEWQRIEEQMSRHRGRRFDRSTLRVELARTVAAVQQDATGIAEAVIP